MALKTITANRLGDGVSIWSGPSGTWVERVAEAVIFDAAAIDAALAAAKAAIGMAAVIEPYAIDVAIEEGRPVPLRLRERIRARGPSVRPDLGPQADHFPPMA